MSEKDGIRRTVRFRLNGALVELADVPPTRTVLQYLREDTRRCGTKEGCAEGDCGACTVVVVDLSPDEELRIRAVNSCIQFLPTLDGKELITVEGLRTEDGRLHPAQQALVDEHGSQCGFCTPGFVMSMFALYKTNPAPSRTEIDDALAGNLCRCTGYRPIVAAAEKMYRLPVEADDWAAARCGKDDPKRVSSMVDALKALAVQRTLSMTDSAGSFLAPRSLAELEEAMQVAPNSTLLAGGTDVGLWVTKQHRDLPQIIYTGHVEELLRTEVTSKHILIGAAVTVSDAMVTLASEFPELNELFVRYGSPPIRNAATLGGNVANGSPIGDSMPALIALGASVRLRRAGERRDLALEDLYLDYQETALRPGEFVEAILIPRRPADTRLGVYKVSKRFDQDISAVCGAFFVRLEGARIAEARVAFGGMAATPRRAPSCEAALTGHDLSDGTIAQAARELGRDYTPIGDARASAAYRARVSVNLLRRFQRECAGAPSTGIYDYGRT